MSHHCNQPGCRSNENVGYPIEAELAVAEPAPWWQRPLTITLTTRNGTTYVLDGVQDDTRVHLSSLDDVDKAALRVLLQQALREMSPPLAGGGQWTNLSGITLHNT